MSVFLVTYDLNKETKRPQITKRLKDSFASWAKLSESSYAISTGMSPKEVYQVFDPLLDSNDQLYVITLRRPYWGLGPDDVNAWLRDTLPG